ncbi:hypothetical protein Bhyg_17102 [Pseudolycoriella hygida]|uniref:Transcription factor Adf-1 n=1 Tax=Pseudolycoriella hygida TaxID=35572 RepID=A0A9Q0RUA4_9DIPT|nr:hypothetical protein Bhyg_17102 [Pseudolycoriella hygida]
MFFRMYEEALRMIDFVKSKPFLYDRKDVDYNKNQKKNSAWEKISEILQNKSPKECKRKWSTLRIQQRRILLQNIARKRKSSHWQFYEPLQFLLPHMEVNSNADTARSSYSDESENDESESITYIESDNKNFNLCQMDTTTENRTFDANSQVILSYPSDQQQEHFTASEQNEHLNQSIVVSKADTITHSQESQCHMHNKNDISLNYFLMDVQLQMNKLNDLAQMELKIDIQKMILEKLRKSENLRNDG